MKSFRRPVIVVVDDLDRCEPGYVVELIRGMQTILVSSRIVFVLLGDRDWIEQAFSETHAAMDGIEVGPEHGFGGRFVEKAIQFSFVLPDIDARTRHLYVRHLLGLGELSDRPTRRNEAGEARPRLQAEREAVATVEAVLAQDDYVAREAAAAEVRESASVQALPREQKEAVLRNLAVKLSLRAATDRSAERATSHMIEVLAPMLPPNPRQIKRIVNAISLMQEAARLQGLANPGTPEWQVMARWVVLMTEWPRSWFTLSRFPGLADMALNREVQGELPDQDAEGLARKLCEADAVIALLTFADDERGWQRRDIDSREITWLRQLMPPTSGRMLDPAPQPEPHAELANNVAAAGER